MQCEVRPLRHIIIVFSHVLASPTPPPHGAVQHILPREHTDRVPAGAFATRYCARFTPAGQWQVAAFLRWCVGIRVVPLHEAAGSITGSNLCCFVSLYY